MSDEGNDAEGTRQDEANDRAHDSDAELLPRCLRLAAQGRNAAEDEQGDALYRQPFSLGHKGVGELMQKDGGEEGQSGHHGGCPALATGPVPVLVFEEALGEPPRQQDEDGEPAPVHEDVDPEDAKQPVGTSHYCSSPGASARLTRRSDSGERPTTPSATLPSLNLSPFKL